MLDDGPWWHRRRARVNRMGLTNHENLENIYPRPENVGNLSRTAVGAPFAEWFTASVL